MEQFEQNVEQERIEDDEKEEERERENETEAEDTEAPLVKRMQPCFRPVM